MRDLIIKHRIFFGIIILLIVLTIPLTVIQVQQQQTLKQRASFTATSVSVALNSPSKNLSVDEIVSVTIAINNPNNLDVSGADITLTYPADLFSYVSESFQPAGGNFTLIKTQSGSGTFQFVVANPTTTPMVDGNINVGTLKFKSSAAGTASINFSAVTITAQGHDDLTVIPPTETYTYTISDAQRSDAASSNSTKLDYVLCGSGLKCENNIKVDTADKKGFNKCLSNKNFSGADKINGKYLTRCNSDLYYFDVNNNNECSLVPGSNPSTKVCMPPESPKSKDYVPCEDSLLDSCEDNTTVEEACSRPSEQTKCLASAHSDGRDFRGADKINGKYLTCCNKPIQQSSVDQSDSPLIVEKTKDAFGATLNSDLKELAPNKNICDTYVFNESCQGSYKKPEGRLSGVQCCVEMGNSSCESEEINIDGKPGQQFRCQKLVIAPAVTATLTITNPSNSVDHKGNLSYNFTGFQPGNIDVWVTKRDQSERTGDIANATAGENGSGDSIIYGLTELAGEYTLWAKGSNGVSAKAEFTINPPASVADTSDSTACATLAAPTELACDIAADKISWKTVDGATGYNVRIDNLSNDWVNETSCLTTQNEGDICNDNVSGTSIEYVFAQGTNYHIAVHTVNDCGGSVAAETDCSRPAPGDTVIRLPAGAFATLFTNTKGELIARKDKYLTIYLYKSDVDPRSDPQGSSPSTPSVRVLLASSGADPIGFYLGRVDPGTYKVLLKTPQYLRTLVSTITVSATGGTVTLATLTKSLAGGVGDLNDDNVLNIEDYNGIVGCFGAKKDTSSCLYKDTADLNNDDVIDGIDYNIFLTSLSLTTREGD